MHARGWHAMMRGALASRRRLTKCRVLNNSPSWPGSGVQRLTRCVQVEETKTGAKEELVSLAPTIYPTEVKCNLHTGSRRREQEDNARRSLQTLECCRSASGSPRQQPDASPLPKPRLLPILFCERLLS